MDEFKRNRNLTIEEQYGKYQHELIARIKTLISHHKLAVIDDATVVKNVKELMKIYEDQQQLLIDEALKEASR